MTHDDKIICLITGATQGIGAATARELLRSTGPGGRAYHVLVGCRDAARGEAAVAELLSAPAAPSDRASAAPIIGTASPLLLDVTSPPDVLAAAARSVSEFFGGRLDVLVNNAGALCRDRPDLVGRLRADLEVNVIGAAAVTEAFLPLLRRAGAAAAADTDATEARPEADASDPAGKSGGIDPAAGSQPPGGPEPRLIFVSSSMGSLAGAADREGPYYRAANGTSPAAYRASKAALNMLMLDYWKAEGAHEVGRAGLRVCAADPGINLTRFMGEIDEARRALAASRGVHGADGGARLVSSVVRGELDGCEGRMVGRYGISPW